MKRLAITSAIILVMILILSILFGSEKEMYFITNVSWSSLIRIWNDFMNKTFFDNSSAILQSFAAEINGKGFIKMLYFEFIAKEDEEYKWYHVEFEDGKCIWYDNIINVNEVKWYLGSGLHPWLFLKQLQDLDFKKFGNKSIYLICDSIKASIEYDDVYLLVNGSLIPQNKVYSTYSNIHYPIKIIEYDKEGYGKLICHIFINIDKGIKTFYN